MHMGTVGEKGLILKYYCDYLREKQDKQSIIAPVLMS